MTTIEQDKIYHMDCLEGMKGIADRSIDAVIADLPYGVLNRQNGAARWDNRIPLKPLWEQYLRITKADSPIILFAQGMFSAELVLSQPKLWRYNLVWHKDRVSGHLNANRMPLRQHEDILVFYRKLPAYHPQMNGTTAAARWRASPTAVTAGWHLLRYALPMTNTRHRSSPCPRNTGTEHSTTRHRNLWP